jgi:hypothetical protein
MAWASSRHALMLGEGCFIDRGCVPVRDCALPTHFVCRLALLRGAEDRSNVVPGQEGITMERVAIYGREAPVRAGRASLDWQVAGLAARTDQPGLVAEGCNDSSGARLMRAGTRLN